MTARRRKIKAPAPFIIIVLGLLVTGILLLSGCGDDEAADSSTASTAAETTATVAADGGPSAGEINNYVEQVRELVHIGDQLNVSYRDSVDRYNSKEIPAEEVIVAAEQNVIAYGDMVSQLEGMQVPDGLDEAHEMVVAGFEKWELMYQLDARGLRDENTELLDQARALDNEAVAEVNAAIDEINQMKD
jgi:hypothetical protein